MTRIETAFIVATAVAMLAFSGCVSRPGSMDQAKAPGDSSQSLLSQEDSLETDSLPTQHSGALSLKSLSLATTNADEAENRPRIVIRKRKRQLLLYSGNTLIKAYRIALGLEPQGTKSRQGDGRTPEGHFYVCTKNPKSRFHLSLGISYPSIEDAKRGLARGLITRSQYESIEQAIAKGQAPPWSTKLGGAICIHGGGTLWDWTLGCIALSNKDMDELFAAIPVGTPIEIRQ